MSSAHESPLDSLSLKPNHSHEENLPPGLDPEDNSDDDDDEEDGEEVDDVKEQEQPPAPLISSGMPPISESQAPVPDATLSALSSDGNPRRVGSNKRKKGKGKGKGKGKPNVKKLQAIEEKVQTLIANLNPIPFSPPKILDFARHEWVLRRLGLWEFVQIDFDRDIRVDLIAQLVATYEAKSRASYVNDYRITVSRADLARAIKLPSRKKEKGVDADLEGEAFSDESIGFVVEIVSDWVLLHEDMWMMPNEVMEWLKTIKEGHPEKVDWAGLFWFMVEKELKQGSKLRNCYYASHLQHLIKYQRKEVFVNEEPEVELAPIPEVEEDEANLEDAAEVIGVVDGPKDDDNHVMVGPSTELTLGQDGEKEEGMMDANMMDVDNCKVSDEEGEGEKEEEVEGVREGEQGQWLLDGRNDFGEHFMQPCDVVGNGEEFGGFEVRKEDDDEEEVEEEAGEEMDEEEEEEEEEAGNDFHVFQNDHSLEGDGYTGNLLQALEVNNMTFNTTEQQLHRSSSGDIRADMQHLGSTHSFLNATGKRVMDENELSHHRPLGDGNKRLRLGESWENKQEDLGSCFNQIQHWAEKAQNLCEEKDQALEQANMSHRILLSEVQRRDAAIDHLHKSKVEEVQKKDREIYRLERELFLMETVLEGYKNAFKETQKAFAEYRERAQLPEESTYKDAGPGGLMLTAAEIEKLEKKREEELKATCVIVEQKAKETEEYYRCLLGGYFEKVTLLDQKLTGFEATFKSLTELHVSRKNQQTEEKMPEAVKTPPNLETEEKAAEAGEALQISETGGKTAESGEPLLVISEIGEEVPEAGNPLPISETGEEVPEVMKNAAEAGESLPISETGEVPEVTEKAVEADKPLPISETGEVSEATEKAAEAEESLPISGTGEKVPEVAKPYLIADREDEIMTDADEPVPKE